MKNTSKITSISNSYTTQHDPSIFVKIQLTPLANLYILAEDLPKKDGDFLNVIIGAD